MNSLYRYRNVASIIEATPFRNPLQGAAAIQSQIRWRLRDSRCYSGSGSSNKSNGSFNWGPPMALFAAAGLGYFYFFSSKDKKKAPASSSGNPLDSLDKLQDAEVVFVLGGPGAGKGTQCSRLVKDYKFVHLSAGDLLRAERSRPDSEFSVLINTYIAEGKIVPMEITIALLHAAMKASSSKKFLIDGFPRKMDQALAFEDKVAPAKYVLYFECPEEEMLKRLLKRGESSGRVDDNIESIKKRFATFRDTSYPVIEYYKNKGLVRQVSCLDSVDKVYAKTVKHIVN